jgi:hypothetical protein
MAFNVFHNTYYEQSFTLFCTTTSLRTKTRKKSSSSFTLSEKPPYSLTEKLNFFSGKYFVVFLLLPYYNYSTKTSILLTEPYRKNGSMSSKIFRPLIILSIPANPTKNISHCFDTAFHCTYPYTTPTSFKPQRTLRFL